ncbi:predicted protein [Aspergillus terreus NIH2624]|uniref:C2H2-type domain-containing protein n=1 Tax=Aspergillus terreus (strain NIH 2624 / FGSC A1156) TaxID=341663 RepID=Q0CCK6_ASPTN|nr:uncharacterized protein ATEG_08578 [Aspergillus terreus NIH2624]EAU30710.1 predicted protein [Aspergillus terreus NIH2624]
MASNTSRSSIDPRDRDAHEAVYSQSAGVCGAFEYPVYPLTLYHDPRHPPFLNVFRGNGDTFGAMNLDAVPNLSLTASAEGAQGTRGSDYIDLTQSSRTLGPKAESHVAPQKRDVNSTVGQQSRNEAAQKTFMCKWDDCHRRFRREAELMRHVKTIHFVAWFVLKS